MTWLNMKGPYKLTAEKIDEVVTRKSPGNYALGKMVKISFAVSYVGRSDDDLNSQLKYWAGKTDKYEYFSFSYATSPKDAFEKECKNYHDFGGSERLDNNQHPQRSEGKDWRCPLCDVFD